MRLSLSFSERPNRLPLWRDLLPYGFVLAVTLALYVPSMYFDFVWDDVVYIQKNYRIQGLSWQHWQAIWTHTYLGHYAPLHHSLLAVLYFFSVGSPFGMHAGQVLLHASCVLLLFLVLKQIESRRVAFVAALLFAVHPTGVETVAWISESKSTLAFLLFLVSFWFFMRFRRSERLGDGIACGVFYVLSMLAKINTIVAPAIFLLYDYRQRLAPTRKRAISLAIFFLISPMFVAIHLVSFHGSEQGLESSYFGGPGTHLLNLPLLVMFYIRMTLIPYPLSAWQMFPVYTEINSIVILVWLGLCGIFGILIRSGRTVQFWALWFLVFLLPVLQIIPFPIWVADRYLYIPAIGIFVLAARGGFAVYDRLKRGWPKRALEFSAVAVTAVLAWQTHDYLPVWRNDLALWSATTPKCATSAYCHANLGQSLLREGHVEAGVKELIRAVELRPAPRYLTFLGDAYTVSLGDYRQALVAYRMAEEQGGSEIDAEFYAKLARCHIMAGDLKQAEEAIRKGQKINGGDLYLLVVNGFLQWKSRNWEHARRTLAYALAATGQWHDTASFLLPFWGRADEVEQLLSDLRSGQGGPA